jgi:hypothetical protein
VAQFDAVASIDGPVQSLPGGKLGEFGGQGNLFAVCSSLIGLRKTDCSPYAAECGKKSTVGQGCAA